MRKIEPDQGRESLRPPESATVIAKFRLQHEKRNTPENRDR